MSNISENQETTDLEQVNELEVVNQEPEQLEDKPKRGRPRKNQEEEFQGESGVTPMAFSKEFALVLISALDDAHAFNLPLAQTDRFGVSYSAGRQVDGSVVVKVTVPDNGFQASKDRLRFLASERPRLKAKADWAKRTMDDQKTAGAPEDVISKYQASYDEWNGKHIESLDEEASILSAHPEVLREDLMSKVANLKSQVTVKETEIKKLLDKALECETFSKPTVTSEDGELVVDDRYAEAAKVARDKADTIQLEIFEIQEKMEKILGEANGLPEFSPTSEFRFEPGDIVSILI